MSKQTAQQRRQDRMKKIVVSSIAFLLIAVLLAGFIVMGVQAVETPALNITVTDGTNPISGANVTIEQVLDPSTITQNTLKAEYIGKVSRSGDKGIQSGAIFDHYYIHTGKGNTETGIVWFYLWDLETNTQIASIPMQGDGGAYKNNNSNFGTEYYDENDKFPLLYVSSAYDIRIAVIRIYEEDGEWKAKQVQVIDYSEDFSNENGFYSCNLMLDNENGFLWLTPLDNVYNEGNVTKQMFFKFHMPKFNENSTVVLDRSQSLQYWETSYEYAPQGGFLQNNTIYQVFGPAGRGMLRTFDLTTGQWTSRVNLASLGYVQEPEACAYYNGAIYSTCPSGNIWKITPTEEYESNATLLDSLVLNDDTEWEVGFLATPGASGLVSGQEHSQSGNKIYRTDLIPVFGSEYIHIPTPKHYDSANGGHYKWKIYWYGTDATKTSTTAAEVDFVSQAGEQTDFDCQNYFQVPNGAAYVRICVASVLSSGTEKVFPADKFYADGGLTVQRYRDESTVSSVSVNDSLVLGFLNHSTGAYSNASQYNKLVSTSVAYPTNGAKLLYVTVPEHPSAANGDYYKWKVLYYKGDTFLGLAHEISDLENHPVFDIPAEADNFKISIASMVNDAAVNPFPLQEFIADGGMTVTLAAKSNVAPELPWMDPVSATTAENGVAGFNPPEGAFIRVTVTAEGYKTATGTFSAEEYAEGLTVNLAVDAPDAEDGNLNIFVTDGVSSITGATVKIEQTSNSSSFVPVETEATLLDTVDLTSTAAWKKGYFHVSSGSPGTYNGEETNPNAKIFRTDLIPVEGSDYIVLNAAEHYDAANGGFYKWRLLWYGTKSENGTIGATSDANIDFVGFSSEQTDLSQHTQFAVPEGACYVRIAIASVVNGSAVTPFPVDTFCTAGGMQVSLYRDEATVKVDNLRETGYLEVGGIDATTGAFVTNALHCRTNAPFSTMGASMLAVSFPATESVSYKWQVLFYNNNNFVSASAEQTGLDTHVYFDIPEDANEYKIAFTSVVGGVDTAIDLPAFCQNGGFNVTLYGADLAQKEEWITKEGTTDENGLVSFEVPAGANYKITVSMEGYVETSVAVTPEQYTDTVTVTMEKEIEYSGTLDITVNDGSTIIPGATVQIQQILDSSLLRQDTTVVEKVGGSGNRGGGCQGGGIYDHYFVQVEKGSGTPLKVQLHIYDLNTNRQIALVALEGDGSQYKNNNANFGTEFYDENDLFPLLYISSAYDARTVAVRIYQDNGEWKAQQVQVIDYSEDFSNANGFYSCNVLLDNENGFMYLTPINATYTSSACTKQWFYKFNMPKLSDGYRVIIDRQDALTERIETAYEFAPQGACIVGGKVYQVFGGATSGKLGIFNLATGEYETKINLYPLGYNDEPESVGFYNGSFYGCGVGGGLYKITPKAYIKETPQVPDILQSTITLNKDADWEVGFMNTPGVSGALDGQETQQGNKIYRTGLIDVSGCDYIYIPKPNHFDSANGGYYKWKVYFYGHNAQLGATTEETIDFISVASETSDFSTANEILIPIDAKYARIAIASVLSSGTQQTFPESTFLEDGGMTVQFYESAQQDDPNLWVDKSVTTDENGNIKLDVVPGASFKVTVSAAGYETLTKTITADDYLEGVTVTLVKQAYILGDADGDGHVDAFDASAIIRYTVGTTDAEDLELAALDLDGDGHVDAYDASLILQYSVGIIDRFPVDTAN